MLIKLYLTERVLRYFPRSSHANIITPRKNTIPITKTKKIPTTKPGSNFVRFLLLLPDSKLLQRFNFHSCKFWNFSLIALISGLSLQNYCLTHGNYLPTLDILDLLLFLPSTDVQLCVSDSSLQSCTSPNPELRNDHIMYLLNADSA